MQNPSTLPLPRPKALANAVTVALVVGMTLWVLSGIDLVDLSKDLATGTTVATTPSTIR